MLCVVHRLSCVMARPRTGPARVLLQSLCSFLVSTNDDGITFGGVHAETNDVLTGDVYAGDAFDMRKAATKQLTGGTDATWAACTGGPLASKVFMLNHDPLLAATNCIPATPLSSNEAEKWAQAA